MLAVVLPIIKALLALLGLTTLGAAAAAPTPKQAVLRRQLARATSGATVLPPRYQLAGPIVINPNPDQVAGSGDLPDSIDPAAPGAALQEIARLDSRWGRAVEAYRSLHDGYPTQASIDAGTARIVRYHTRWAILRATVDALIYDDPFAEKWGEQWAFTDATTNEIDPAWLEMVSLYAPTPDDWSAMSQIVEDHYNRPPAPGVLDYLGALVDTAGDALALDWRGALRGAVKLSGMGSDDSPTLRAKNAQMSREELGILAMLQAWVRPVQVEQLGGGVRQFIRTAQEALSGGGTPLDRGVSSLGGRAAIALRLRGLPELTEASKLLSDDALVLKAALIARRWPTVGAGYFHSSPLPKPAASSSSAPSPFGGPVNSRYQGPQQ